MAGTQVRQIREPVSTDTGTQYQVTAQAIVAGTLPDVFIFLFEVIQDEDPKSDAFTRVVTPADFDDYGTDRDASITANTRFYRAAQVVLLYDGITDANSAYLELTSRISDLVTGYDAYIDSFVTLPAGEVVTDPTADESEKAALIAQYEAAAAAVTVAEEVRDEEVASCDVHKAEYASLQERLVEAQSDYTNMQNVVNVVTAVPAVYAANSALANNAVTATASTVASSSASAADKTAVASYSNNAFAALSAIDRANADFATGVTGPVLVLVGTLQLRVNTLSSEVLAMQQTVNDCQLELATMQGAVDAARATRDAALAAVRAVCPDYVPGA